MKITEQTEKKLNILKKTAESKLKTEAVIDRFEGGFAVCELDDGKFINVPRSRFPGAKEGDTVVITEN